MSKTDQPTAYSYRKQMHDDSLAVIRALSSPPWPGAISRLSRPIRSSEIGDMSRPKSPGAISRLSRSKPAGSIAALSGPRPPGAISGLSAGWTLCSSLGLPLLLGR